MTQPQAKKTGIRPFLGNMLLAVLGIALSLVLLEMVFRAFPNSLPAEVRVNPPSRRVQALVDSSFDLKLSDGDLFTYMKGNIRPLSPDEDRVVAQVHMVTDANGFRNALPEKETYDVVALGDSFTRSSGVAAPWTERLAEQLGKDVFNLGDVAFGPQDELKVLQEFGVEKRPKIVILAYYEGNDLYDAGAYDQANPFIITRFGKYILNKALDAWRERGADADPSLAPSRYRYPITVSINHKDLELAFFSYFVSWLSADRETIEASQNYRLTTDLLLQMRDLSAAQDARFLLVYVPSKEHVYLPYVQDADTIERVFKNIPAIGLDEAGFMQFTQGRVTREVALAHMDDQSEVIGDFAAAHNLEFLNLTSTFQEAAGEGQALYYTFDTHWNQDGHDLAARTIAHYLEVAP